MNATTLFVLQITGPALVLMSLAMLFRSKDMQAMYLGIFENVALRFLFALILFVLGMAIVLKHNVWGNFKEIVVSVMGWGSILKGVLMMLLPELGKKVTAAVVQNVLPLGGAVVLLVGAYITYVAYWA